MTGGPMRYLRFLCRKSLVGLRNAGVRYFHFHAEKAVQQPQHFREDEFESEPSLVMRRADIDGSAVITDKNGKPRMRIGARLVRSLD